MHQKYIKVTARICIKQKIVGKNTSLWQCENVTNDNSEVDNDNDHSVQRFFFSYWVYVCLTVMCNTEVHSECLHLYDKYTLFIW